jgi:hypothetical protein
MGARAGRVVIFLLATLVAGCSGGCATVDQEAAQARELLDRTVRVEHAFMARQLTAPTVAVGRILGSGAVVAAEGDAGGAGRSLVLTADHVCAPEAGPDIEFVPGAFAIQVRNFRGEKFDAEVLARNQIDDLCVLAVAGRASDPVSVAPAAPPVGALVVHVGGPRGMFLQGLGVVSDARYAGTVPHTGAVRAVLSGVAAPGSSGSGIFYKNRLVGIVVATLEAGHPVIGADLKAVRQILDNAARVWSPRTTTNRVKNNVDVRPAH